MKFKTFVYVYVLEKVREISNVEKTRGLKFYGRVLFLKNTFQFPHSKCEWGFEIFNQYLIKHSFVKQEGVSYDVCKFLIVRLSYSALCSGLQSRLLIFL